MRICFSSSQLEDHRDLAESNPTLPLVEQDRGGEVGDHVEDGAKAERHGFTGGSIKKLSTRSEAATVRVDE